MLINIIKNYETNNIDIKIFKNYIKKNILSYKKIKLLDY